MAGERRERLKKQSHDDICNVENCRFGIKKKRKDKMLNIAKVEKTHGREFGGRKGEKNTQRKINKYV